MDRERKRRIRLMWQGIFLALLIVGTIFVARHRQGGDANADVKVTEQANGSQTLHNSKTDKTFRQDHGFVFGTVYNVTYQSTEDLKQQIEAELAKVDSEFSMFNEQSTVSAINRGEQPERSAMFEEVYQLALTVSKETDGAFDITVAPLVNAWGFGFKNQQMPTPAEVDSLRQIRSQLDFSAIAKGYGSDVVARYLRSKGISDFMIEIGGEVVVAGKSPANKDWRIGVTKPTDDSLAVDGELQAVLQLTNIGMATSGNYRNFYYKGGRKYAHTIDPRTGYPVQHSLLSATVLARNCAVADAYATSMMVLGLEKSKELLARHQELKAYLIYTDEKGNLAVWHSPGLHIEN